MNYRKSLGLLQIEKASFINKIQHFTVDCKQILRDCVSSFLFFFFLSYSRHGFFTCHTFYIHAMIFVNVLLIYDSMWSLKRLTRGHAFCLDK
jgi:hypothetical protein